MSDNTPLQPQRKSTDWYWSHSSGHSTAT